MGAIADHKARQNLLFILKGVISLSNFGVVFGFGFQLVFGSASWCVCQILHWRLPRNPTPVRTSSNPTITILRTKKNKKCRISSIHDISLEQRSVPLWWSAYFCSRSPQWHFFLLPFVWAHCGVCFHLVVVPDGYKMMNLLNKQVKQSMTRTTCIIYIYICVCVCEDGFNIQYNISEEGCGLTVQMSFMVFIRSLLYKTVFKSPHLKTGLTKSKHFHP